MSLAGLPCADGAAAGRVALAAARRCACWRRWSWPCSPWPPVSHSSGVQLTILHLVGMLLIVAVGSNYALFFDRQAAVHESGSEARTPGIARHRQRQHRDRLWPVVLLAGSGAGGAGHHRGARRLSRVAVRRRVVACVAFSVPVSAGSGADPHGLAARRLPSADDFLAAGFAAAVRTRQAPLDLHVRRSGDWLMSAIARLAKAAFRDRVAGAGSGHVEFGWRGISLGGLVALDYAASHPGELDGLCLLAPYLGNRILTAEIVQAPGLAAGSRASLRKPTRSAEYGATSKSRPRLAAVCTWAIGQADRFAAAHQLLAATLPPVGRRIAGGHEWPTWLSFGRIFWIPVSHEQQQRQATHCSAGRRRRCCIASAAVHLGRRPLRWRAAQRGLGRWAPWWRTMWRWRPPACGRAAICWARTGPACRAGGGADRVAITIDDGPDPEVTPQVLDLPRRVPRSATFFCVGERVRALPGPRAGNRAPRTCHRESQPAPSAQFLAAGARADERGDRSAPRTASSA